MSLRLVRAMLCPCHGPNPLAALSYGRFFRFFHFHKLILSAHQFGPPAGERILRVVAKSTSHIFVLAPGDAVTLPENSLWSFNHSLGSAAVSQLIPRVDFGA